MVVSSSMPSWPWTTMALITPLAAMTESIFSAMAGSLTPTTCRVGRAGLVRGRRKLNTVGMPSSRLVGTAWRKAEWKRGARQNPMPASATQRATPSGPRSTTTPKASSTSADPPESEAPRLPCLQTLAPAPATTKAAMVDTLMVWLPSPPVPHVSTRFSPACTGSAWSSMARTRPDISSIVSPLLRRPSAKPAIWAEVALPSRTSPSTAAASSDESDSPRSNRARTPGQPPRSSIVMALPQPPQPAPLTVRAQHPARDGAYWRTRWPHIVSWQLRSRRSAHGAAG